jgi:hypothetical protein
MNPRNMQNAGGGWKDRMPGVFPMVLGADLTGTVQEGNPGLPTTRPVGDKEKRVTRRNL